MWMKTQSTHAATSETTTQPSETDVITADRAAAQGVQGHLSLEAQVTLCERGYVLWCRSLSHCYICTVAVQHSHKGQFSKILIFYLFKLQQSKNLFLWSVTIHLI